MEKTIAMIRGDGIGPEIVEQAIAVLDTAAKKFGHSFCYTEAPMGGCAIDEFGVPLPESSRQICLASDSVLLGAVGGPKWDAQPPENRPEKGLLKLRGAMNLYSNIRPAHMFQELASACPLRADIAAKGVDFVVVRELIGGVYFGEHTLYEKNGEPAAQDIMPYTELAKAFSIDKLCTVTRGGETRTESVLAGITAAPENAVLVAVHDGARPLVSEAVITEAVTTAAACGAAAPVVPVKDSIKRIENGNIAADVARDTLAAVQTPQVFRKDLLRRALTSAAERGYSFTDDCAAVESLGTIVKATHGSYQNIKITTPEDILVAEALLTREDK